MPDADSDGRERDSGQEVSGELVVARGDAPEMFDLVEEALDEVALSVELRVDGANALHIALAWDVSGGAEGGEEFDDGAGAVAAIGHGLTGRRQAGNKVWQGGFIGRLAGSEQKTNRQTDLIDDGVDLGRQSSTRTANGVIRAPFFPPAAC
jgi:hypothetical protein